MAHYIDLFGQTMESHGFECWHSENIENIGSAMQHNTRRCEIYLGN